MSKQPRPARASAEALDFVGHFDYCRARAYCTCSRCGRGLFGHFYAHLSFLSSFSLSLGDGPIKTEILSQRAVKPKTTNQPMMVLGKLPVPGRPIFLD